MQGHFTLLYFSTCAVMLVFVKDMVQEFSFLRVFVSCFISSLGFGVASNL